MKFVEACGELINTEYITNIWYRDYPGDRTIEIIMLNGNKISFPVLDREDYEEIVRKLNLTKDTNNTDSAR